MKTESGGNCQTWIQCGQTDALEVDLSGQWQVCYVGGMSSVGALLRLIVMQTWTLSGTHIHDNCTLR